MNKVLYGLLIALSIVGCAAPKEAAFNSRFNNIIIRDIANPIAFNGGNLKDYDVSISNGKIINVDEKLLTVMVDTSYATTISIKKDGAIKKFDFRVKQFPKPTIRMWTDGKGDSNDMTVEEFKSLKSVSAVLLDFPFDCILNLESYEVLKITPDGRQSTIKSINPSIDFRRMALVAQKGDTYIVRKIKVKIEQTGRIVDGQEFTMHLK